MGDPDPLVNTVTLTCSVEGFPNVLEASDDHSVNLFQPSLTLSKTGETLSKAGDDVTYTIEVCNTSSMDTPNLIKDSVTDTVIAGVDAAFGASLVAGACESHDFTRTVQAGDPDPLLNVATAHYHPDGFPNDITASDDHSVDLVHPSYTVEKTCGPAQVHPGDTVTYDIIITNTGDVTLNRISAIDSLLGDVTASFPASLAPGASVTVTLMRTAQSDDPNPLVNTITTVYQVDGLPNQLTESASCSVEILLGCALSPGFWGGGAGLPKWDDIATDPIAQAAGFDTNTPFPWVADRLLGATYLEVLKAKTKGDVTVQIAFKYIAARLNQATPVIGVPPDVADLLDAIDVYFSVNPVGSNPSGLAKDQGVALRTALNAYFSTVGELACPDPSTF